MIEKSGQVVTDRFDLFNDGRKVHANNRKYIVSSAQAMANSPETKELLRLGEAFGYYGHGARDRAKKLKLQETEVVMINGKPVVIENVPCSVTLDFTVSDEGIVTHTEEFLTTTTGQIAQALHKSRKGGWSWAVTGSDGLLSHARTFGAFDYVLQPNYISLDHPSMMMESAEGTEELYESLRSIGLDEDSTQKIITPASEVQWMAERVSDLETSTLMLEGLVTEQRGMLESLRSLEEAQNRREQLMLEAVKSLPVYMTAENMRALVELKDEKDWDAVRLLFESIRNGVRQDLPFNGGQSMSVNSIRNEHSLDHVINYGQSITFG
ncbi:head processing protein (plasmid) [Photobacterium sp. CCB-ST2H9]|uniref:head processing protein n=1 Tax=Photobacterium sp. CCB-ST2H9 TaxID=2912855 RepID=UPI002004B46F|nr:head processing protein [Photobacterium sp. CCB-ST2H9]UTM60473.1 head processing protein [Photobacterium sp. CCB-ST2H9]